MLPEDVESQHFNNLLFLSDLWIHFASWQINRCSVLAHTVSHHWVSVFGATEKKALALLSEGSSSFLKWNWGFKREIFFNYTSHNQQSLIKSLRVRGFKPTKHNFWQCSLLQNHRSVEHFFMFSLKILGKPDQSQLVKNVLFCRHKKKSRILKVTHMVSFSVSYLCSPLTPR